MNVFKELYQNRKLIWKLSKNDFRNKFAGAYFGIIWAFIQPMVTVAVYFVVFQLGLRVQPAATGYPYICWLVSGIILLFRCAAKCIKLSAGIQLSGKEGCI